MPSDREIEAAAKAIAELSEAFAYDGSEDDYHRELARRALSAAATARPDPLVREKLARASGLAQAIANAKPYPPGMDGVRDVAAEIAALCDKALASLGEGSGEAESQ